MPYGTDVSVFVEDKTGTLGAPPPAGDPWWLSPDVDIPAHTGEAAQGVNQVQIRVHSHDEPILDEKIVAEVYVGLPSMVLSPTIGTKRIDPGTLLFRPPGVAGSEPLADTNGGTLTFPWTPSSSVGDIDGPGHRCLVLRAFPQTMTPPTSPFDVANEPHEAQHNIEILMTTKAFGSMDEGGAGTPHDPRRREEATGMWWERLGTLAANTRGRRYAVWAFDPTPGHWVTAGMRHALEKAGVAGFSKVPPSKVSLEVVGARSKQVDPADLLANSEFASRAGLGKGVFAGDGLLCAAALDLDPASLAHLVLRFDHSNAAERTAVVMHGAQWSASGEPEGGMTIAALAPV